MNLYLYANGDVGPCCRNRRYGNIADRTLLETWHGVVRRHLTSELDAQRYPGGCELCEVEHRVEGREGSFAEPFDQWYRELGDPEAVWPRRMEFELSNRCNLRCVQCNGELSSAIRARREHRAPLPAAYHDAFFDELTSFLPHLETASFIGGEPFLSPECYRVWDLIGDVSPDLDCVVVTNGTIWNERVESVLEAVRVRPYVSVDGITKGTYEGIRVGSDFDVVMRNLERFNEYARGHGRTMSIVFCVMPSNLHELPDLLLYAEERGIYVTTSNVREPAEHSVGHLPHPRLVALLELLEGRDGELGTELSLNRRTWEAELARLRAQSGAAAADRSSVWLEQAPRILMFLRRGDGPVDAASERAHLAAHADDGVVHSLSVGADGRIGDVSAGLAEWVMRAPGDLDGQPVSVLEVGVTDQRVIESSADRYEAVLTMHGHRRRLVMVPLRDGSGWADEVQVLLCGVAGAGSPPGVVGAGG